MNLFSDLSRSASGARNEGRFVKLLWWITSFEYVLEVISGTAHSNHYAPTITL